MTETELVDLVAATITSASSDGRTIASPTTAAMALREAGLLKSPGKSGEEVRVVDPTTGGEKGQKLARFDLIPVDALWDIAEHFGRGAEKYADRNWERGYKWSLSYAALLRHLTAWWGGEDFDEETGSHHLAAVGFHTMALLTFVRTHPDGDDRP